MGKIIDGITANGYTASICSLDLSKAFDKVNHCALYIKLMQINFPVELLELLENWINLPLVKGGVKPPPRPLFLLPFPNR